MGLFLKIQEMHTKKNEIAQPAIQVIGRLTQILDALAKHHDPVSLKTLSKLTGLHPSTTHRILNDLVICHFVDRIEPGFYRLGLRLLEFGNLVKARINVRELALKHMQRLHRLTGETVNLAVRQGDEIVYIERAFSEHSGIHVIRSIGDRAPLHLTSTGKLFLAFENNDLLESYVKRCGLIAHTNNSLTNISALLRELVGARTNNFARDNEELELGVRCLSAPIRDDTGKIVAGLSVSAPTDRMKEEWLPEILATAGLISKELGYANTPMVKP